MWGVSIQGVRTLLVTLSLSDTNKERGTGYDRRQVVIESYNGTQLTRSCIEISIGQVGTSSLFATSC